MSNQGLRRFHMGCCVGRGGFGEVYQAEMAGPGGLTRTIAVKLLRRDVGADTEALRRLRDEARLLAWIRHPVVVRGFDLVRLDGRIGLVTEFVEGEDLIGILRGEHRMPLRPLLQVLSDLASALGAAWSATGHDGRPLRIVHRDVKPTNVRIGRHGEVKLLDFGIARFTDAAREARTDSDVVIGSIPYMAPERFVERTTTPAADVYGLGCLLYEGLGGRRFHEDGRLQIVSALALDAARSSVHLEERLWQLPPVAPPIAELLRSCLAHDPVLRPPPGQLAADVAALAESSVGPSLRRWCRDRPWKVGRPRTATLEGQVLVEAPLVLDPPPSAVGTDLTKTPRVGRPIGTLDPGVVEGLRPPPRTRRRAPRPRVGRDAPSAGLVAASVAMGCFVVGLAGTAAALAATLAGFALLAAS
jgi:serine/threonine protein kinase